MAISSSEQPAVDRVEVELDHEIESLEARIASLHQRRIIQAANIINSSSSQTILKRLRSAPKSLETEENNPLHSVASSNSQKQLAYNQECLYRVCSGVTTFKVKDPDPCSIDKGAVLGIRIEAFQSGRFIRPYYVFLNRHDPDSSAWRVHRHTVPPCIPLDSLADRYLPAPTRSGDLLKGPKQALPRFVKALRSHIVGYHNRITVIAHMRRAFGLSTNKEQGNGRKPVFSDISAADAEAKHVRLEWMDGRIGRAVISSKGKVVKCVVIGEEGRDRPTERAVLGGGGRIEVKAVKHEVPYEHGRTLYKPIHTPPLSPPLNRNTTFVLRTMSQIPHLLSPYVALPSEASLTLLTSVLGASTNWLVLRYLQSYLGQNLESLSISSETEDGETTKVLLVSFMRDFAFWKDGARKLGLDLDKLAAKKRFAFIDGLSELYLEPARSKAGASSAKVIRGNELENIHNTVKNTLKELQAGSGKVVLVIDQLDLLLSTSGDKLDTVALGDTLMDWRLSAHSTVLTLAADTPLAAGHDTPLETNHSALLLNLAHQADLVMSLRLLDTGTARDVSGVCRITTGDTEGGGPAGQKTEARELLYFVGGDSAVKVFERGQ
ncbi:hypothetical protein O988_01438 [Pseudogymnoascus sp. VKM F-3808]|nr:hypothetical protein O988_01438 [Pseudogymnoascus sp. VKM F-3808]